MIGKDGGRGLDQVHIEAALKLMERVNHNTTWRIDKFDDPNDEISKLLKAGMPMDEVMARFGDRHIGESEFQGNILLNEGIQQIWELVAGLSTPTMWNNANANLGVGESSAAELATHTGLQGATTTYKVMDGSYPQRTNQTCDWRGTFGSGDANIAWQEFSVVNGPLGDQGGADINLNRKVSSEGTKTVGQTWVLTVSITLT